MEQVYKCWSRDVTGSNNDVTAEQMVEYLSFLFKDNSIFVQRKSKKIAANLLRIKQNKTEEKKIFSLLGNYLIQDENHQILKVRQLMTH